MGSRTVIISLFYSFVVVVSEAMACHVNCDFSVSGQGFNQKITLFSDFHVVYIHRGLKRMKSVGLS